MQTQDRPDTDDAPVIMWFRRDLRLSDNPALLAAAHTGRPVIPLYIHDEVSASKGAAALWRLEKSLEAFEPRLAALGSPLVFRKGSARSVLQDLISQTGAVSVYWGRDYSSAAISRDTSVKTAFRQSGINVRSFPGMLLWEPWDIKTKTDGNYRVFSPFWRRARTMLPENDLAQPDRLKPPKEAVQSENFADWNLGAPLKRGGPVLEEFARPAGEEAAQVRLDDFLSRSIAEYDEKRDRLDLNVTSGLSAHLALGEISPRTIWNRAHAMREAFGQSADKFLSEVAWREFAYHLSYFAPKLATKNWRPEWDDFRWREDNPDAEAWRRGATGVPVVDAAMREMYVTGTMHNRARMIVASYLTKHLLTDWRVGLAWFADCLVDWDPAANAMGWQWVAGCGPDAAPFFRIFNPETQAQKFDCGRSYVSRFLPQENTPLSREAAAFYDAVPKSWAMSPSDPVPTPPISLAGGRARALEAYNTYREGLESAA